MTISRRALLAGAAAVGAAAVLPSPGEAPASLIRYSAALREARIRALCAALHDSQHAHPITGLYGLGDRAGAIFKQLAMRGSRLEGDNILFDRGPA